MGTIWSGFNIFERVSIILTTATIFVSAGWLYGHSLNGNSLPPLFEDVSSPNELSQKQVSTPEYNSKIPTAHLITIHVVGAVKNPGVIQIRDDLRVFDAIKAAGGGTSGAAIHTLNLASKLEDGTQIRVPSLEESAKHQASEKSQISSTYPTGKPTGDEKVALKELININSASQEQLELLPGIGPAIALRIIEYRNKNGRFETIEELDEVKGIGLSILNKLRKHVTL